MNYHHVILCAALLLAPATASAATQSSPNYSINGGRIVSGGSKATDASGMSKTDIVIGQGMLIPPGGGNSPSYIVKPNIIGSGGGLCAVHGGDINCDGVVDIVDALLAIKAGVRLVQLSAVEITRGDVGPLVNGIPVGNGKIDIEDAILVLRKAVGLGW